MRGKMTTVHELMLECGVAFGTSGARGMVTAMTDRVCYSYTVGFLQYLAECGDFAKGGEVALAGDLRPSTPRILTACAQAVIDAGGVPVFCGYVPTPALAAFAFARHVPSLMVTGSHIPADRNGIKFYRPDSEVLKEDEAGMARQPLAIDESAFDAAGALVAPTPLPVITDVEAAYVARYTGWFSPTMLAGKRIGVYQHSAVGRDVVTSILAALGAEVTPLGRSDIFMPVDTEAIRPEDVDLARGWSAEFGFDAIASTDGDSDRPLLADENGEWLRGDVLGILCASALGADAVVTPISSNTALEKSGRFAGTVRTRIGSPYVIAAMNERQAAGAGLVCGYEANGGFLLGSTIESGSATLTALPTRDAVLPILAALSAAGDAPLSALVGALPSRFTFSDRITPFPQDASKAFFASLLAGDGPAQLERAATLFSSVSGQPAAIDLTDGFRITFANAEVIHFRGSGNAPELRCYTEADSAERAQAINAQATAIVRGMLPG